MCGSVIVTGGLFLLVMNVYNYHMVEKENRAKDREQKQNGVEDQDELSALDPEMKPSPVETME